MKSKEEIIDSGILEEYVLGNTDKDQQGLIETYLASFPELKVYMEELEMVLEYSAIENAIEPPDHVKANLLNAISLEKVINKKSENNFRWYSMAASFTVGFIISALLLGIIATNYRSKLKTAKNEVANVKEELNVEQNLNENLAATIQYINHKNTKTIQLKGSQLAPNADILVYLNSDSERALVNIKDLPSAPSGTTYQMWADVEGEMINMGIFDGTRSDLFDLGYIENAETLNITLEPEGGSVHPTVSRLYANGPV